MSKWTRRMAQAATLAAAAVLTSAGAASADPTTTTTTTTVPGGGSGGPHPLDTVVHNATLWVMGLLAGLATLFLVIGGGRYVLSGGDPGQVEKAKLAVRGAIGGYALAALAPVIVAVLRSIVGV